MLFVALLTGDQAPNQDGVPNVPQAQDKGASHSLSDPFPDLPFSYSVRFLPSWVPFRTYCNEAGDGVGWGSGRTVSSQGSDARREWVVMLQLGHSVEEAPWFDVTITGVCKRRARSLARLWSRSLGVVASATGGAHALGEQLGCGCVGWVVLP